MSGKTVFFDTNVLVYVHDRTSPAKQAVASQLLRRHIDDASGVISSQVIQEFCNLALRKFRVPLTQPELEAVLEVVMKPLWQLAPNVDFYQRVVKLYAAHSLSFYDACIVQAAVDLECSVLYSEDLQDGQRFGELAVVNPFKEQ